MRTTLAPRILGLALAALIGGLAAEVPAFADSSIRVLVNDQPITSYQIAQRARLRQVSGAKGGEKAAIDELIDEILQINEARKHGVVVPDSRVDAAIAQISQGVKMTTAQLTKALGSAGVGIDTLKDRIRAQIAWMQVVQAKVHFEVAVKGSDVMAALAAKGSPDKVTTTEFTLQQIIFVVPKGSSAAYADQRRREAEGYRIRYAGCDKAIAQAKGLKDVVVRPMGRRVTSDLTGDDGKEVQNTPVGKTTRPQKIDQGIELVAVCSSRVLASNAAARSQIENQLSLEQGKDVGKDYLKQLRDKAIIQYR